MAVPKCKNWDSPRIPQNAVFLISGTSQQDCILKPPMLVQTVALAMTLDPFAIPLSCN